MADKEIIIDGVIYNKCNGCSLYDGNICTGAKTYEDNAERDRHICDEHLASQFWVVFNQLKRKEQECEELKKDCPKRCKSEKYKQALDEIEEIADDYNRVEKTSQYYRDGFDEIQDIINKAKDSE